MFKKAKNENDEEGTITIEELVEQEVNITISIIIMCCVSLEEQIGKLR